MSKQTDQAAIAAVTDTNTLAAAIAAGIAPLAQGIASLAPKPEMKEGDPAYTEYLKAQGLFDVFEKPVYQNGYEAEARGLSEEVRTRVCRLRPGQYLKRRVTVEVDGRSVHLKYPTKREDDRMINMGLWSSFSDLVNKIWDEMHQPVAAA